MNSNSYIIQKLNSIFKNKNINIQNLNEEQLTDIFKELDWSNIKNIIPEVLEYYSGYTKYHQYSSSSNKLKNHFITCLNDKMNDIKLYISILEKNHTNTPTYIKYKEFYSYYINNYNKIGNHFNEIKCVFDIVNIKYDRRNFLPYCFIIDKIIRYMGNNEFADYLSGSGIKSIYVNDRFDKIWFEMNTYLKWNT